MYKKKLVSLMAVMMLTACMAGCGDKTDSTATDADATQVTEAADEVTPTEEASVTEEAAEAGTEEGSANLHEGCYLGFEDSAMDFLMLDTAPADSSDATMEVVDFNGSKAVKVTSADGKIPYIGIDASSILGDNITKVAKVSMVISAEYPDGNFYSIAGKLTAYSGEERTKSEHDWSIFLEDQSPKECDFTLKDTEYMVAGAQNIFVLTKATDNAFAAGEQAAVIYLDDIVFYDADGNALPVDATAGFDRPAGFGEDDMSNLTTVVGVTNIEGATGTCDAWGQAASFQTIKNDGGTFDPALLAPGSIITLWYQSEGAPSIVLQSWSDGPSWVQVTATQINDSNTIGQITYDEIVAAWGSEDFSTLDCIYIAGAEQEITYTQMTIGQSGSEAVEIEGTIGTCGAWGQAVTVPTIKDDGTFDPSWIAKGTVFTVKYEGTVPQIVLQSYTDCSIWAQVDASSDTGTEATYTYEDMVAAYGSDDFSNLDAFIIGGTEDSVTVNGVSMSAIAE